MASFLKFHFTKEEIEEIMSRIDFYVFGKFVK